MGSPVTRPVDLQVRSSEVPEITDIRFDCRALRLELTFLDPRELVSLAFPDVVGFRVLEEADLQEFWEPYSRSKSWLCQVQSGGWLDQEKRSREVISFPDKLTEYFVAGEEYCVNVWALSPPKLEGVPAP